VDREELIMKVITSLEKNWENLMSNGPLFYRAEYTHWCATIGQPIQILFPDGSQLQGLAHSIGEHGQLRVIPSPYDSNDQSARIRDIHSGEILHLRTTCQQ
jgi:biotin-(acetyl-CoA carboxylase) ligase